MIQKLLKYLPGLGFYGYFALFFVVTALVSAHYSRTPELMPDQPIDFSHNVHINKVGMQCLDCHYAADKSKNAGVPPVSKCMSCHENVATDRPEIKKLTSYWDQNKPIEWERIHKVPDYVYFSHKRHVSANIPCQSCHGQVQNMEKVSKTKSLLMGWCVECHRENGASIDCQTCHK